MLAQPVANFWFYLASRRLGIYKPEPTIQPERMRSGYRSGMKITTNHWRKQR